MDPNSVKSTLSNLAFGNVMAAAARDYQKNHIMVVQELIAQEKSQTSSSINQEVDLDVLMDKEAEKRETLKKQGHGEYREIAEGDFLGEVTGSEKVICHFYHREFYRCKIMDKHLKVLALRYLNTKFIKPDAEDFQCLLRRGTSIDRLIGFQDLGGKDDFTNKSLEILLIKKSAVQLNSFIVTGIISEKKEDEEGESRRRTVRSSVASTLTLIPIEKP
uniref:Thioredoxin domain-containing protein n=1 Tax=Manihot esculenta TaxID=3983 RepID=A0A2C9WF29_MANES